MIEEMGAFRECKEHVVIRISSQCGIVLVGEHTYDTFDADHFTPLEFSDERYAVKNFAFEVPCDIGREEPVVEELHVVHQ